MIKVIKSDSNVAAYNLELEKHLLRKKTNDTILFLWKNAKAVVVGKHQCILDEVNLEYTKKHHIEIARRLSGGGAVYHDLGNLNVSFIMHAGTKDYFSMESIMNILIQLCEEFGIKSIKNQKNDILVQGKKIIGTAERINQKGILRHCCILVNSDLNALENSLIYRKEKYDGRAIPSVRSRVENMQTFVEDSITVEDVSNKLIEVMSRRYELEMCSLK